MLDGFTRYYLNNQLYRPFHPASLSHPTTLHALYIGLCYGPPGVGKTLSARRYSRADSLDGYDAGQSTRKIDWHCCAANRIEKRIARFPQLYSRIDFVHEFRPLGAAEVQELLERCWTPPGVILPNSGFSPEVVARLIRMTGGNLRLLTRLLTRLNASWASTTPRLSVEIVEAARDSLVIGQA